MGLMVGAGQAQGGGVGGVSAAASGGVMRFNIPFATLWTQSCSHTPLKPF